LISRSGFPAEDICKGYLHQTYGENGEIFNCEKLMSGLMRINYNSSLPADAYVRVRSHGHWFYIDNKDLSSKITFTILVELIHLSSGYESNQTEPALTLPVR
jgi:hypothetical protein